MICTDNVRECNHFVNYSSSIRLIYVPLWVARQKYCHEYYGSQYSTKGKET
jgi:hypothetical protein